MQFEHMHHIHFLYSPPTGSEVLILIDMEAEHGFYDSFPIYISKNLYLWTMLMISLCTLEPKFTFVTFAMGSGHFRSPKDDVLSLVFDPHMSEYSFHRLDNLATAFHGTDIAPFFRFVKWVDWLIFIVIDISFSSYFRFKTVTGSHSIFQGIKNIERVHFWSNTICSHIHFKRNLAFESTFKNIQIQLYRRITKISSDFHTKSVLASLWIAFLSVKNSLSGPSSLPSSKTLLTFKWSIAICWYCWQYVPLKESFRLFPV